MHADPTAGAVPPQPLLAPTEALLRGFELEAAARPTPTAARTGEGGATLAREGFRIGTLHLMVRYEDGSELTDLPTLYRLPNAPGWFLGMANLHGALVPVFDPAPLLEVAHAEGVKPMLLVLGHADEKAGVVIDGLPVRLKPGAEQRLEQADVPPGLQGCVDDVYRIGSTDWLDFRYLPLFERLEADLAR